MKHRCDLNIHTCFSPFADLYMTPIKISNISKLMRLDIISITDHNVIHNIKSVMEVADAYDIEVIPSIEIETKEKVHILGYFENLQVIEKFYDLFEKSLPKIKNQPESMGKEVVMDIYDEILYEFPYFLNVSSNLSVEETVSLIHSFDGLAFASRIDKTDFLTISNFEFITSNSKVDWIKVVENIDFYKEKYRIISSLDSYFIEEIGKRFITFEYDGSIENRGFEIFKKALKENMIECHL